MWTNINYLFILPCVFLVSYRLDITDPVVGLILYFCFLPAQFRINFGQISFVIPCVFPAFYMYIIEPILGFVYFVILDSRKGPTEDGLFGLVSYRVPLVPRQSIL